VRIDLAVNFKVRVPWLVEALRPSQTTRVQGPAWTVGNESVWWPGSGYVVRIYDRGAKTIEALTAAWKKAKHALRRELVKRQLDEAMRRHPRGTLARIEVSITRGNVMRQLALALNADRSNEPDLVLRVDGKTSLPVKLSFPHLHEFMRGEVAKIRAIGHVASLERPAGNKRPHQQRMLAALAVKQNPGLVELMSEDAKLIAEMNEEANALAVHLAAPNLMALCWPRAVTIPSKR
jgi:hypothetical protein